MEQLLADIDLAVVMADPRSALVLLLVGIGVALKSTRKVSNRVIPATLLVLGALAGAALYGADRGYAEGAVIGAVHAVVATYSHSFIKNTASKKN